MAELVAIINVTPDSFSDGGRYADAGAALAAIEAYATHGAAVVDIGAESTRPGAMPISPKEEWKRLQPVLSEMRRFKKTGLAFSVDTRHAETAAKALALGADWINDVTGFSSPEMAAAVKDSDCRLVMMHSLSVPADRSVTLPENTDVAETLLAWAKARLASLEAQGIARERIIFDPGLGFGKTAAQSHAIVRDITKFKTLGVPMLVGHSRKSFLSSSPHRGEAGRGASTEDVTSNTSQASPHPNPPPAGEGNRDAATLAMSLALAEAGVDYLRVHDVASHTRALHKERKYG